jgi:2-C-methyl-D-erythritol 4-phosphate cytidylyltransferase
MNNKCWAILPASGIGARMNASIPKQYLNITVNGKIQFIIDHTLERLLSYNTFYKIIVVISDNDQYWKDSLFFSHPDIMIAKGGQERCLSVLNGLNKIQNLAHIDDLIAVHDVVRPCITHKDLDQLFEYKSDVAASANVSIVGRILATRVKDTMKKSTIIANSDVIKTTVDRNQLWHALTPQVFPYGLLSTAIKTGIEKGHEITDEASAMEFLGYSPRLIEGRRDNIKITYSEDISLAELFIQNQINHQLA